MARYKRRYGETNPQSKLTAVEVRAIRALATTESQYDLSRAFGVHQSTISRIVRGLYWSHL